MQKNEKNITYENKGKILEKLKTANNIIDNYRNRIRASRMEPVNFHRLSSGIYDLNSITVSDNKDYKKFSESSRNINCDIKKSFSMKLNMINDEEFKISDEKIIDKKNNLYNQFEENIISINDMNIFLNSPMLAGKLFQCEIRKDNGFTLFHNNKILFTALKRSSSYSYTISSEKSLDSEKTIVLNSNFLGTEFFLRNKDNVLAGITYDFNMMGIQGPRKMKVYIPKLDKNNIPIDIKSTNKIDIKSLKLNTDINLYHNKKPVWSEKLQAYVLDFNKRVRKQSVKNFQIIDQNDSIILQFGKITDSSYVMDFTHPFSPLQAFAISITSIDRKFGCQ